MAFHWTYLGRVFSYFLNLLGSFAVLLSSPDLFIHSSFLRYTLPFHSASAPSPGPPGLGSDIAHILSGGVDALTVPEVDNSTKVPVPLPGLVAGGSTIVSHATIGRMEAALPRHYRGYKWYLLYSTFR